jgi:hypothetical protein
MPLQNTFTLITSVRDEGPFILEWVAHHKVLGFDRICVASNDCSDGSKELLEALAAGGFIEHLHHIVLPGQGPQRVAYAKMREHLSIDDTEWLMVLDIDEFLNVHVGNHQVCDLVARAGPECDIISLHALCFTGHGQQHWEPGPICPRQQWRLPLTHRSNRAMKSLTRHPRRFQSIHNHSVAHLTTGHHTSLLIMAGDGRQFRPEPGVPLAQQLRNKRLRGGEHQLAHYNHYCVKTWDSFNLRRMRGRGASGLTAPNDRHTDEYYIQRSTPDTKDLSIGKYAEAVKKEMANMLQMRAIGLAQQECDRVYSEMCKPFRISGPHTPTLPPKNTAPQK